jgi:hypothetical protein
MVDARWNTREKMRLMLSRTGVLVVGVTSVRETARARARERVSACVHLCVSRLPRLPLCRRLFLCVHVSQREPERDPPLGRPWTSPFIDTRRCPAVQRGVAMRSRGWRGSALSPVHELLWPSEKCLEPCRSIVVGAAWILLTLSCFRRGLRAIRCHGRTRGTIITCYRSNLRWDTGLVPS